MTAAGPKGHLACVGLGMMLGAHLAPRSRAYIEQADVVYVAASDALVELWVQSIRPDAVSLQPYYAEGKSRRVTYREMVDAMLSDVRRGRRVCGAFYGHPGVFAQVPHQAIEQARAEGFGAVMEPGISAEACLYADLGIDPGRFGCQHYEATQFLLYPRRIDPSAYLVLWQLGVVGNPGCTRRSTLPPHRRVLAERLLTDYPPDHRVVIYEAATSAIQSPRIDTLPLSALPGADVPTASTLVVPPAQPMRPDPVVRALLDRLDSEFADAPSAGPLP